MQTIDACRLRPIRTSNSASTMHVPRISRITQTRNEVDDREAQQLGRDPDDPGHRESLGVPFGDGPVEQPRGRLRHQAVVGVVVALVLVDRGVPADPFVGDPEEHQQAERCDQQPPKVRPDAASLHVVVQVMPASARSRLPVRSPRQEIRAPRRI